MTYTPIPVGQFNLEAAIRENMLAIIAELQYKWGLEEGTPMLADLDMQGSNVKGVDNPVLPADGVNLITKG